MRSSLIALALLAAATALGQADYSARFETAWQLVAERYWNLERLDVDWQGGARALPTSGLAAVDDDSFYSLLEEMYTELGDNHSVFVPPARVEEFRDSFGDLPCLGIFSQAGSRLGSIRYRLLRGGTGYIELPDLVSPGVADNVRRAVRELVRRRASGLILDLRGNPGGRLLTMMQVAGIFTRGFLWRTLTNWTLPIPYPAIGAVETELPLVVLIDGGVNSAAEGLAGALQQRGRATVIGERSAGNVEAVLPFCLRDGSQAWIATGVLAPIRGPTWEGRGVVPDIAAPPSEAVSAALRFFEGR